MSDFRVGSVGFDELAPDGIDSQSRGMRDVVILRGSADVTVTKQT